MKLFIDSDEKYPFWELVEMECGGIHPNFPTVSVELSDDQAADYKRVMSEFQKWQDYIEDCWDKRSHADDLHVSVG